MELFVFVGVELDLVELLVPMELFVLMVLVATDLD